jgi:hypothetical protein
MMIDDQELARRYLAYANQLQQRRAGVIINGDRDAAQMQQLLQLELMFRHMTNATLDNPLPW